MSQSAPPSRRRRIWFKLLLVLLLLIVAAGGTVLVLLRSDPPHYRQHRQFLQRPPEQIQAVAQAAEMRVIETLAAKLDRIEQEWMNGEVDAVEPVNKQTGATRLASGGEVRGAKLVTPPTVISLSVEEINAWIATNFQDWMTYKGYEMPAAVQQPMFALTDGQMVMAFEYNSPEFSQVFSAGFEVDIQDDGRARVRLLSLQAGQLPVPGASFSQAFSQAAADQDVVGKAAQWLDKINDYEFSPVIKLDPQRKVRILNYSLRSDGVDLTVEMEAPLPSSRKSDKVANVPVNP